MPDNAAYEPDKEPDGSTDENDVGQQDRQGVQDKLEQTLIDISAWS